MIIRKGGLDDPQVIALLKLHVESNLAQSPPESCHVLDLQKLKAADITFWSAWEGDALMGVGALKRLSADHGEVKSMHTAKAARRRGVGAAMLDVIVSAARAAGMRRVSLETGSQDYFAPARALYARHGFVPCAPFGGYTLDPNSMYFTCEI